MAKDTEQKASPSEETNKLPTEQTSQLPVAATPNFEEDAGAGSETITTKDQLIPFINILQKLSPQLDKQKPSDYLKGAEEGFFLNTATKRFWPGDEASGILFIPFLLCYSS